MYDRLYVSEAVVLRTRGWRSASAAVAGGDGRRRSCLQLLGRFFLQDMQKISLFWTLQLPSGGAWRGPLQEPLGRPRLAFFGPRDIQVEVLTTVRVQ